MHDQVHCVRRMGVLSGLISFLLLSAAARLPGADFIRGDVNSDGEVSLADAQLLALYFAGDVPALVCQSAADANDDGTIDPADSSEIFSAIIPPVARMPAPFPQPGPDPTPDLGCDAYGGGEPLEDPAAAISIVDSTVPGGDDGRAIFGIALTSSAAITGFSGTIQVEPALLRGETQAHLLNLTGMHENLGFGAWRVEPQNTIRFGFISSLISSQPIPAGSNVKLAEISACLSEGLPAGVYHLTLLEGEIIDAATGRSIQPTLLGGDLTLSSAVNAGENCRGYTLAPLNASFQLTTDTAPPGGQADVTLIIRADAPVQGYAFSIDFDEEALHADSIDAIWAKPDASEYAFKVLIINNDNRFAGNAGIDEGFVAGAVVFDQINPVTMPPDVDNDALGFHFSVKEETSAGATEVRFVPGARGEGQPIVNTLVARGRNYTPDLASSFVLINGRINVLPDITSFSRGDSNGDGLLDISDPQTTLAFLYLGDRPPACLDAADFNDDGELDIADPVAELTYLFFDGDAPPAPSGQPGADPTEDSLGCLYRR